MRAFVPPDNRSFRHRDRNVDGRPVLQTAPCLSNARKGKIPRQRAFSVCRSTRLVPRELKNLSAIRTTDRPANKLAAFGASILNNPALGRRRSGDGGPVRHNGVNSFSPRNRHPIPEFVGRPATCFRAYMVQDHGGLLSYSNLNFKEIGQWTWTLPNAPLIPRLGRSYWFMAWSWWVSWLSATSITKRAIALRFPRRR